MNPDESVLRISLDGEWLLSDFGRMPTNYARIYSFLAHVQSWTEIDARNTVPQWLPIQSEALRIDLERLWYPREVAYFEGEALEEDEAVENRQDPVGTIFSVMERNLVSSARLRVRRIHYASPGYVDVAVWTAVAGVVGKCISAAIKSAREINTLYDEIHQKAHNRRLRHLNERERELKAAEKELAFLKKTNKDIATLVGLDQMDQRVIEERLIPPPPRSELVHPLIVDNMRESRAQRVLLSAASQIQRLAGLQQRGKSRFNDDDGPRLMR